MPTALRVHVNDWREPTRSWADRLPPGEGVMDLPAIFGALEAASYDGWYDLEILDDGTFGTAHADSLWALDPWNWSSGDETGSCAWQAGVARWRHDPQCGWNHRCPATIDIGRDAWRKAGPVMNRRRRRAGDAPGQAHRWQRRTP